MALDVTQTLLSGLIDYAGLFPPASESMHDTVRHYQEYSDSPQSWVLGRLIIPLDRLDEFRTELSGHSAFSRPWHISCLWPATSLETPATIANSCEQMRGCVAQSNLGGIQKIVIDTIEVPCNDADGIRRLSDHLPAPLQGFIEMAWSSWSESCLDELQRSSRLAAKIRTGGVTPQAIPPVDRLAEFLRIVTAHRLPFKCTAGLHHPLPAERALTYQPNAPTGTMHGFWNVAIATGLLLAGTIDPPMVGHVLSDQDADSFAVEPNQVSWNRHHLSLDQVQQLRHQGFFSFGSCSFCEPVEDLQELGWLPNAPC